MQTRSHKRAVMHRSFEAALVAKPDRSLELFSLMARGDRQEHRRLSLKEGADRLGLSLREARACFADPSAWHTVLDLVDGSRAARRRDRR